MRYRYQSPPPSDPQHDRSPEPAPPRSRIAVPMPLGIPRLTYILLAVNVLIFMYTFRMSPLERNLFFVDWGKLNQPIIEGEYYRLFTAMFLHLDIMHMFFNGYALYLLGRLVESLFGTGRFAIIYFLGGLSGSLASFVFTDGLSIGASGAISAIFSAAMVYFYHHRHLHGQAGQRQLQQLIFIMVLNLALGFSSSSIDNAGHIGGFVGGLILAWFIGPAYSVKADMKAGELVVIDENPIEHWALPSVLYTAGLALAIAYAVSYS